MLRAGDVVDMRWEDCDRATITRRYDRLARFIPLFDRLLFLRPDLSCSAVEYLQLRSHRR